MHAYKMYAKYRGMVPTLSGPLGLPWCGSHWLTNCPSYLLVLLCFVKSCCVQTNCLCHVQSIGIVPMHEWKVPLKYWGMLPFPSGLLLLRQAADTKVWGGGGTYEMAGIKIYTNIHTEAT